MDSKKVSKIKQTVLKKIKPSEKEVNESLNLFKKIQKFIKTEFNLECELMGSVAKKTFLKGNKDLDIFVLFPKKIKEMN